MDTSNRPPILGARKQAKSMLDASIDDLMRAFDDGQQAQQAQQIHDTSSNYSFDSGNRTFVGLSYAPAVPQGGAALIRHLSQAALQGQDAGGDEADEEDDSDIEGGDPSLAHGQRRIDLAAVRFLIDRIDSDTLADARVEAPRAYIGGSVIGTQCDAYIALNLRGFPNDRPSAQIQRIFDEGHRIEPVVVAALKRAGLKIKELDDSTGKQWHYEMYGGHVAANLDGKLWKQVDPSKDAPTHTLEIKSMQRRYFMSLIKKGLKLSHPEYYDQVQLGMGMSGIGRCFFVAYCKDNSKYHAEFVYFDEARYAELLKRSTRAMFAEKAERTEAFDCTMCLKRTSCGPSHIPSVPNIVQEQRHCRHCAHSMPNVAEPSKTWTCKKTGAKAERPCGEFAMYRPITIKPYKPKGRQ